ncbi:hypothetical protein [Kamptonema formosum]|uniref:hypothetical protein n=1 Tax=Kamptonema formosum TaxID=331992 RepID=UPI00034515C5|nr:hypothetical protein [Oscillatoria sp. PCC 10802]
MNFEGKQLIGHPSEGISFSPSAVCRKFRTLFRLGDRAKALRDYWMLADLAVS